jgi:hypothetical protein
MSDTTHAYTYQVNMVLQVLATSEEEARAKLDEKGGFISSRDVNLIDSVALHSDQS